jgi:hypothetical protein
LSFPLHSSQCEDKDSARGDEPVEKENELVGIGLELLGYRLLRAVLVYAETWDLVAA